MNTLKGLAMVLCLTTGQGTLLAHDELYNFESNACPTAYQPNFCGRGAGGWTAYKPGPLNGALCRTLTRTGTCSPSDGDAGWGFPGTPIPNPDSWDNSQFNNHYMLLQVGGSGVSEAFAFTHSVVHGWGAGATLDFYMAGKIQNQNNPAINVQVQVGFSIDGANMCNIYPTIAWLNANEVGQAQYAPYPLNTTVGANVVWQRRSVTMPAGAQRFWIRFVTPAIILGTKYGFYLDDIRLSDGGMNMALNSDGVQDNADLEVKSMSPSLVNGIGTLRSSPNPTTGLIQLQTADLTPREALEVFNANGELVLTDRVAEGSNMTLDLSAQPPGIYLLKYVEGDRVRTARIVRE